MEREIKMYRVFRWVLAVPFLLLLSGCIYDDSTKTRIQIAGTEFTNSIDLADFFIGFEKLLLAKDFELSEWNVSYHAVAASRVVNGQFMYCEASFIQETVKMLCVDSWKPILYFLNPRASEYHKKLVLDIATYASQFGALRIERILYNNNRKLLSLDDLKALK